MNTESSHSLDALLDFLRHAGTEGLINPAAARARRKAVEQLMHELTERERADIRCIDSDSLVSRFHKLEGSSIRPETLQIYAERFTAALAEYLSWLDNPAAFISPRRERARAYLRGGESEPGPERAAAERIALTASENTDHIVPVPIRPEHVVWIANLPLDLSPAEAERIAGVIRAYAGDCPARSDSDEDGA
ncbi:MAG: hypothetical protein CVV18_06285 [Gammaproteobacteria bacterium HGW-Gammaproteobacteria-8]|nr:MAG: hypothetical protein CVV18_06285 [Gammaproteobacteria bacterium HGW-Gammaproteobacteria-8]